MRYEFQIPDDAAMQNLGGRLATLTPRRCLFYLVGDLGAGKTTLVRGFLRALGYIGPVKSPTYTLLEEYVFANHRYIHLDLYRLESVEELEYLGLRDLLAEGISWWVEWPERGKGVLPAPDIRIEIAYVGEARRVVMVGVSATGADILVDLIPP